MITIVSGLPRSGTSLMMQMLAAGGLPVLADFERQPDADNPRGYYEWEPAKLLPKQPEFIDQAEGKVVKVISQLLLSVPAGRDYRVIFMERPFSEMLASQDEMLKRRGKTDFVSHDVLSKLFERHLAEVAAWLKSRPDVAVHRLPYSRVLADPTGTSNAIQSFLGVPLDVTAMARQADPSLYRNRKG